MELSEASPTDTLIVLSTGRYPGADVYLELYASPEQLRDRDVAQWLASQSAPPSWRGINEAQRWLLRYGFIPLEFDGADSQNLWRLLAIGADILRIELSPVATPRLQSLRDVFAGRIVRPLLEKA